MTISINGKSVEKKNYVNEDELQKHIFSHPYLLQNDNDSQFYPLGREVVIYPAGKLDILFLEENGTIIAVEVKLSKNSQSRREVVAQIFDYVSALSSLNYYELDEILKGKLEETVLKIDEERNLPRIINSQLKAGFIKIFIAVDESNEDLQRIMSFICERTNLDVRLIEISKYADDEDGKILEPNVILVPSIIIERSDSISNEINTNQINPFFEEVIVYYNSIALDEFKTRTNNKRFCKISKSTWPKGIHYEFLSKKQINSIGVEFHIETDDFFYLEDILINFSKDQLNGKPIMFDNRWSKNRGRLFINFENSEGKEAIGNAMKDFINKTNEIIDNEIKKHSESS